MDLVEFCRSEVRRIVPHYSFEVSKRFIKTYGYCDYVRSRIVLSYLLFTHGSEEEVKDILYHEIAHALNPFSYHDEKWRRTALKLGSSAVVHPDYLKDVIFNKCKYKVKCTECGNAFGFVTKPRLDNKLCALCLSELVLTSP